jgi:hypothetical protein
MTMLLIHNTGDVGCVWSLSVVSFVHQHQQHHRYQRQQQQHQQQQRANRGILFIRSTGNSNQPTSVHHHRCYQYPFRYVHSLRATGADIEQPLVGMSGDIQSTTVPIQLQPQEQQGSPLSSVPRADIPTTSISIGSAGSGSNILSDNSKRGKVNEIDYCIAPADVSLSRAYGTAKDVYRSDGSRIDSMSPTTSTTPFMNTDDNIIGLSLTRALNNASNRAVRRILLSRSWPSPDSLNRSLRQVAAMEAAAREQQRLRLEATGKTTTADPKCPVPRPILNVLTGKSKSSSDVSSNVNIDRSNNNENRRTTTSSTSSSPRNRSNEEYIADQIQSFRMTYGTLSGYIHAEEYLQCVLALATSGIESPLVSNVIAAGIYDEAYQRIISVLQKVGVEFVSTINEDTNTKQRRIADKLKDQDICLSVLDKLQMRNGDKIGETKPTTSIKPNDDDGTSTIENTFSGETNVKSMGRDLVNTTSNPTAQKKKRFDIKFWSKNKSNTNDNNNSTTSTTKLNDGNNKKMEDSIQISITNRNGVLVSMEEPQTMTQQLNVLSNIVQRVLLFGGDQEILVVSETLAADLLVFINRWYPTTESSDAITTTTISSRPGVDYIQCLVQLLQNCYRDGIVSDLDPPIKLRASYANSYERLVASAVELGSGYIKPIPSILQQQLVDGTVNNVNNNGVASNIMESNIDYVATIPKPRTAQEELGRFALLESNFRQAKQLASLSSSNSAIYTPYPMDLVGKWEVRDEIGGEIIGSAIVTFNENGNVDVLAPLEGLRWRLDPGPTHLDTCTFQVLSTIDRTILQYRGFIDRGARLESRFSKRPLRIRGSVMFQMRDGGSIDYYKDMLPINYRTGTTKFVMTKIVQ